MLEISVGTGRNLDKYDWSKLTGLTLVDSSAGMIDIARKRVKEICDKLVQRQEQRDDQLEQQQRRDEPSNQEQTQHSKRLEKSDAVFENVKGLPRVEVVTSAIEDAKLPAASFDIIVDTMGICSHADPVRTLRQIQHLLKPDGRVVLFEHGLSFYKWLNRVLAAYAEPHFVEHGCMLTRDMPKIVRESGLEIVALRRYHLGLTCAIEAKLPNHSHYVTAEQREFLEPN